MELCIRKNFSFPPVSFLFEIYMEKRKIFRMHNSIMGIESVLGSFWMALSACVRTFTDHSIKCSQILFSIKKVSRTLLIRMPKIGAL